MFSLFKKKINLVEELRANPAASVMFYDGEKVANSSKLEQFIDEGYISNVIAFRCINEIATCLAGIDLELWKGKAMLEDHALLKLLKRPNPMQGKKAFFRQLVTNYKATGNSYILGYNGANYNPSQPLQELWHIGTEKVEITAGSKGLPQKYTIRGKVGSQDFIVNQVDGGCQLFHFKEMNPKDDFIGMSSFSPAAISCDLHNAGLRWNYSLLKNGAKVPFAVMPKDGGSFSMEQKAAIKEWFAREYQGSTNAGKPLMIGGVEIEKIGLDPVSMDFSETIKTAANNICLAFGVPPVLITGEGNTFNNVREARESFYENTVLPLLDEILDELNRWLIPAYRENLILKYNPDSIAALEGKRELKYKRMALAVDAGLISRDEARTELGFDARGGASDNLFIETSMIPIEDAGLQDLDYKVTNEV